MQCGGRRQRERAEEKRGAEGTEEALFTQDRTRKLWRGDAWTRRPGEEHAHGLQRQSRDGESPPGQRNVRNDMAAATLYRVPLQSAHTLKNQSIKQFILK